MSHKYNNLFFQYIELGSTRSASLIVPLVIDLLKPNSVLDVGCGRGAWCSQWVANGVLDVIGVDGDYVDTDYLLFDKRSFHAVDLKTLFNLNRQFDLVVSLEVAEHIPEDKSANFIDNLTAHGCVILFSAAPPGQGGEFHVNEQPLEYWRNKFNKRGYAVFDIIRPLIAGNKEIEPWYRYNTLLFAHSSTTGLLSPKIQKTILPVGSPVPSYDSFPWALRKKLFKFLPNSFIQKLSVAYHRFRTMGIGDE